MLHYLRVGLRITITQSHTHTMQQTRTHKAVTRRIEAKKLLSHRRQSEYSIQLPSKGGERIKYLLKHTCRCNSDHKSTKCLIASLISKSIPNLCLTDRKQSPGSLNGLLYKHQDLSSWVIGSCKGGPCHCSIVTIQRYCWYVGRTVDYSWWLLINC